MAEISAAIPASAEATGIQCLLRNSLTMGGLFGSIVLQTTNPSLLADLPGYVRGAAAFFVVLVLGAGLLWRFESVIDQSIEASSTRPLSTIGYGVATHIAVIFFGFYANSQIDQFVPPDHVMASAGIVVTVAILAGFGAVGFTVVGVAAVEMGLNRGPWYGLFGGALFAGLIALADPLLALVVWLIVVSMGIGGSVRNWFTAAADVETAH